MKVSTDSIAFGSWCKVEMAKTILDIGTGTGLLSLMMAQKSSVDAQITALEIDKAAFEQAKDNINDSPWPEKINLVHTSLQAYSEHPESDATTFDLIISNPPWFEYTTMAAHNIENQKRDSRRTLARQQIGLSLDTLLQISGGLLRDNGELCLVLPTSAESSLLSKAKKHGFQIAETVRVRNSEKHTAHCQLWRLIKASESAECTATAVFIRTTSGDYSTQFKVLCREFYLNF